MGKCKESGYINTRVKRNGRKEISWPTTRKENGALGMKTVDCCRKEITNWVKKMASG